MSQKLGIALSGGGARGFAHLGVLQVFRELGIRPDIISGTSAGAFAGVFFAAGYMPEDVLAFFEHKTFTEFASFGLPQGGFFKSTGLRSFLEKHIKARDFSELEIPFRVVATDIEFGRSRIFDSGDLISAVVASCSVPIVFKPVEIGGIHYIDGGLFKNFPVSTIRNQCDKLIGVNVSPITEMGYKNSIKYVAERSFHYMSNSNTIMDRSLCDYLIESNKLSGYSMFDLDNIRNIYKIGYDLATSFVEENREDLSSDFPSSLLA